MKRTTAESESWRPTAAYIQDVRRSTVLSMTGAGVSLGIAAFSGVLVSAWFVIPWLLFAVWLMWLARRNYVWVRLAGLGQIALRIEDRAIAIPGGATIDLKNVERVEVRHGRDGEVTAATLVLRKLQWQSTFQRHVPIPARRYEDANGLVHALSRAVKLANEAT